MICGDELFNDSFPHKEAYNGWVLEIESAYRTKGGEDYGFEQGEDEDEKVEDKAVQVIDIIDNFNLQETQFGSFKELKGAVSQYLKKCIPFVKEADGDVKDFKAKATEFIVFLQGKFDELQFYTGPSFDVEGTLYFALTKEGNTTPTFYILTPGLKKQKT